MELDLNELEQFAKEATPQEIDASEIIEDDEGKIIECPICGGDGYVSLEADYCNFDSAAIGVQFYGIGKEHGAAERYYRAANPAAVLELVRRLRDAEKDAQRYRLVRRGQHWSTVDGIGDTLRGEALDRAVDAVMQPPKNEP